MAPDVGRRSVAAPYKKLVVDLLIDHFGDAFVHISTQSSVLTLIKLSLSTLQSSLATNVTRKECWSI